jgi:hypothetical protein
MVWLTNFENNKHIIQGDWILVGIQIEESISHPGFHLLSFKDSNVSLYIDSELNNEVKMTFDGSTLYSDGMKFSEIEFIDSSQLVLSTTVETKSGESPAMFKYVRLVPTKFDGDLDDIISAEYEVKDKGKKWAISFNNEKNMSNYGGKIPISSISQYKLKKIKSTFFLTAYLNNSLRSAIPVREITSEYMKLYAIPNGPAEATAFRIEN